MDISPGPSVAVTGDTTGIRTSGRQRSKPTEFWRNEKPQKDAEKQIIDFPDPETRRQRGGAGPMSTAAHGKTRPMSPSRRSEPRRLSEALALAGSLDRFTPLALGRHDNRDGVPATTVGAGAAAGGKQGLDLPASAARRCRAAAAQHEQLEEQGQDCGDSPPRPRRSQKAHADASPGKSPAPQVAAVTERKASAAAPALENQAPLMLPPVPKNRTDADAQSRRGRRSKKQVSKQQPANPAGAASAAAAGAGAAVATTVAAAATASDPAGANGRAASAATVSGQAGTDGCAAATAGEPAQAKKRQGRQDPVLRAEILVLGIACAAARGRDAGNGDMQRPTEGRHGRRSAMRGAQQQTTAADDAAAGAAAAAGAERQQAMGGVRLSSKAADGDGAAAEAQVRVGTSTAAPAPKPAKARPAPAEPRSAHAAPPPAPWSGAGEVGRSTGGLRSAEGGAAGTQVGSSAAAPRAAGGTRALAAAKESTKAKARRVGAEGSQAPQEQQPAAAQVLPEASRPDADEEEERRPKKRSRKGAAQAKRVAAQAAEPAGPVSGAAVAATLAEASGPGASAVVEEAAAPTAPANVPAEQPRQASDGTAGDAAAAAAHRRKKRDGKSARKKKGRVPAAADATAQPQAGATEQEAPSHAGAGVTAVVTGGDAGLPPQPPAAAAAEHGEQEPVRRPSERSLATSLHQLASSEGRGMSVPVPTGSKSQRRVAATGHDGFQIGHAAQQQQPQLGEQEQPQPQLGKRAQEPQRQPEASVQGGSQLLGSEGARKGRNKRRRGAAAPSAAATAADSRPGPSAQDGSAAAKGGALKETKGGAAGGAPGACRSVLTQTGLSDAIAEGTREEKLRAEAASGDGAPGAGRGGRGLEPAVSGQQQLRQPSAAREPSARVGHTVHVGASVDGNAAAVTAQQCARPETTPASNATAPPGNASAGAKPLAGGGLNAAACPLDAAAGAQQPYERPSGSGRSQAASPEPSGVATGGAGPGVVDAMPPRRMELSPSESVAQSNVLGVRAADAAAGAVRGLHQTQWAARRACSHPTAGADLGATVPLGAGGWCDGEARRAADFRGGGLGRQGDGFAAAEGFLGAGADVTRAPRGAAADGVHFGAAAFHLQNRRIPPPPRFDADARSGHPSFQEAGDLPTSSHHKAAHARGADLANGSGGGFFALRGRGQDHGAQCQGFPQTQAALPSHSGRSSAQAHAFGMPSAARDEAPGAGPPATSRVEAPATRLPGQSGGTMAGVLDEHDAAARAAGMQAGTAGEPDGFFVQRSSHGRAGQQPQTFLNAFNSAFGGHDGPGRIEQADGRAFAAAGAGRTASLGAGQPGTGRFEAPATRSAGQGGGGASPAYGFGAAAATAATGRYDAGGLQHAAAPDAAALRRTLWPSDAEDDDGEAGRRLRPSEQRPWGSMSHASRREVVKSPGEKPPSPQQQMSPQRRPPGAADQRRGSAGLDAVREEAEEASPGLAAGFDGLRQEAFENGFHASRDGNVESRPGLDGGWRLGDGGGGGSGQQQQRGQPFPEPRPQAPTYQRGRDHDQEAAQDAGAAAAFSRVAAVQPGSVLRERLFADVDPVRRQQHQQLQRPDGARPASQEGFLQGPDRRGADWQQRSPAAFNNYDRYDGGKGLYDDGGGRGDVNGQQHVARTDKDQCARNQGPYDGSGRRDIDRQQLQQQLQRIPAALYGKDQYGGDHDSYDSGGRRGTDSQQQRTAAAFHDRDQHGGEQGPTHGSGGRRCMDVQQQQRTQGTAHEQGRRGDGQGLYAGGSGAPAVSPPPPPRHTTPPGCHRQHSAWQPAAAAAREGDWPPGAAEAFPPGTVRDGAYDRVDAMDVDVSSSDRPQPSDQDLPLFASTPSPPQRQQEQQQTASLHETRQQQQQTDGPLEVLQRLAPRQQAAEGMPGAYAGFAAPPAGQRELGQPPFSERAGPWGQRATQAAVHTKQEAYKPAPQVQQQPQRGPSSPPPPPLFQAQPWQQPERKPVQPAPAMEAPAQGGPHGGQPGAAWADAGGQIGSVHPQPPPPPPQQQQQQLPTASHGLPPSQVSGVHKPQGQQPPRQPLFTVPALRSNRLAQQQQQQQQPPSHFAAQQQQQRLSSADGQTVAYPGQDRQGVSAAPAASVTESASASLGPGYESIRRMLNRADAVQKRNKTRSQEFAEREEDGWTLEQHQALQSAFYKTNPAHPNYWAEIARHVPGRTAAECCSRVYNSGKTQDERAMLAKLVRRVPAAGPAAAGSGKSRPPTVAAARKWSQQEHQREVMERLGMGGLNAAEEEQDDGGEVEGGDEGEGPNAGAGGRKLAPGARRRRRQLALPELNPEILSALEDLQKQKQSHKFVTSFFSKQGGITKWHKTVQGAMEKRPRGIPARAAAGPAGPQQQQQQQPRAGDTGRPAAARAPAAGRRRDDAMARYIRQMLAWDKAKHQQEEWREDDRAEGLVDEEDAGYYDDDEGAEGGSEVDEEQERTTRDMMQFLMEEGLLGPDGQPVFA